MSSAALRTPVDPILMDGSVGLAYVSDEQPGIRRVRRGGGFLYVDAHDRLIRDPDALRRVRSLVIPPAWRDVWICPIENGHIQAVGRDARGRKQYRYHPRWQHIRNETKFHRMRAFGRALTRIRRRVRQDLKRRGLPRDKVLAAVISLLECTHIRVGNEEYANQNNSYGLTTFQDRHARVEGTRVRFAFRGKSGKEHLVELQDPRLARIVRACQDLPGQHLFQYHDEQGHRRSISSADVNDYLRRITGQDFTAKDFRTWAGTVLFVEAVRRSRPCSSRRESKRHLVGMVRQVAAQLRNTPAVCRKYYIHPRAIDSFLENSIHDWMDRVCRLGSNGRNLATEKLVMRLLASATCCAQNWTKAGLEQACENEHRENKVSKRESQ